MHILHSNSMKNIYNLFLLEQYLNVIQQITEPRLFWLESGYIMLNIGSL